MARAQPGGDEEPTEEITLETVQGLVAAAEEDFFQLFEPDERDFSQLSRREAAIVVPLFHKAEVVLKQKPSNPSEIHITSMRRKLSAVARKLTSPQDKILSEAVHHLDLRHFHLFKSTLKRYFENILETRLNAYDLILGGVAEENQQLPAIIFEPKSGGVQSGCTVEIVKTLEERETFYAKIHQHGPTSSAQSSTGNTQNVDVREILVYKILEFLCMGPPVHFPWADEKNVYIATRNVREILELPMGGKGSYEDVPMAQEELYARELIKIDVFSRIFRLGDTTTNPGNLMFFGPDTSGKVSSMIVDFSNLEFESFPGYETFIHTGIKEGNSIYNYKSSIKPLIQNILCSNSERRLAYVTEILNGEFTIFPQVMAEAEAFIRRDILPIFQGEDQVDVIHKLKNYIQFIITNLTQLRRDLGLEDLDFGRLGKKDSGEEEAAPSSSSSPSSGSSSGSSHPPMPAYAGHPSLAAPKK
jgi:hypothetical protein